MTEKRIEVGGMSDRERLLSRYATCGGEIAYDVAQIHATTFGAIGAMAPGVDARAIVNLIERVATWWKNLATDANNLSQFLATGERMAPAPEKPEAAAAWGTTREELESGARSQMGASLSLYNAPAEAEAILRLIRQALISEIEDPGADFGHKALIERRTAELTRDAAEKWAYFDECARRLAPFAEEEEQQEDASARE